jgi:hypothetical protein
MSSTGSEEERNMDKFRMLHHKECLAEKHRLTESLPLAKDVVGTPFKQKPFYDKTSATLFAQLDVKHYEQSVVSIALFHGDYAAICL